MELRALEPQIFASQEKLAEALQSGDVWMTPNWRARGVMWQKAGMPISMAVPQEGAAPVLFRAGIANWPFGAAMAFVLMATTLALNVFSAVMLQRRYRG
jgi:hypothetical protein